MSAVALSASTFLFVSRMRTIDMLFKSASSQNLGWVANILDSEDFDSLNCAVSNTAEYFLSKNVFWLLIEIYCRKFGE